MLTGDITEETYEPTPEETPTFAVIDDGRTFPAVVARRRQQNGSRRTTLYTISKNGRYADLYPSARANIIEPYFERKRKRLDSGGRVGIGDSVPVGGGTGEKGNSDGKQAHPFRI